MGLVASVPFTCKPMVEKDYTRGALYAGKIDHHTIIPGGFEVDRFGTRIFEEGMSLQPKMAGNVWQLFSKPALINPRAIDRGEIRLATGSRPHQ